MAVGRRGVDGREVARAHERELEGARNGRGAHGEGVDAHLHLLELFLDGYAEFLLFVDDEQAEVVEAYGLADELVGADEDVNLARGEVVEDGFGLFG